MPYVPAIDVTLAIAFGFTALAFSSAFLPLTPTLVVSLGVGIGLFVVRQAARRKA